MSRLSRIRNLVQSFSKFAGSPTPIPPSNVGWCNVAELLVHSVGECLSIWHALVSFKVYMT